MGVAAAREVRVRSGPRPKHANVPPFGSALKTAGWRKWTVVPSYQAASIRGPDAATTPPSDRDSASAAVAARNLRNISATPRSDDVPPGRRLVGQPQAGWMFCSFRFLVLRAAGVGLVDPKGSRSGRNDIGDVHDDRGRGALVMSHERVVARLDERGARRARSVDGAHAMLVVKRFSTGRHGHEEDARVRVPTG